jgi:hypothetical protein
MKWIAMVLLCILISAFAQNASKPKLEVKSRLVHAGTAYEIVGEPGVLADKVRAVRQGKTLWEYDTNLGYFNTEKSMRWYRNLLLVYGQDTGVGGGESRKSIGWGNPG